MHSFRLMNTVLARCVLALLLLVAQGQAATHWVTHLAEAKHVKPVGSTPTNHCDECLTLSALGAAATSTGTALPACVARHAPSEHAATDRAQQALRLAYHSRAPPNLF